MTTRDNDKPQTANTTRHHDTPRAMRQTAAEFRAMTAELRETLDDMRQAVDFQQRLLETRMPRNILIVNYDEWTMRSLSPYGEVADPPRSDYARYVWTYIRFGGRMSQRRKSLVSRVIEVFRRLLTNSLKPGQP